MIEEIKYKKKIFAIIIKPSFLKKGVNFFTKNSFNQQVGFMKHPKKAKKYFLICTIKL